MMTLSYYYPSASQSYNFALSSIYSPSPTPITAVTAYQGSNPWYVVDVLTQTPTFTVSPTRTPSLTPSPSFSASPTTSPTPSITATPTNLFVYEGGSPWAVTIPTNTPGYNGVTVTSWTAPQYVGVSVTSWSASASIGTTVTAWTATQNVGVSLNAVTSPVPMYLSWVASAYSYTVGGTTFALNVANMFDYDVNTITAFSRKLAPTTSTYLSAAGATAVWASGYGLIYQITVNPASIPGSVITIIDGTVTRTSLSATCAQTYSYPRGVPINNGLSVVIYGQGYDGSVELETSR